MDTYTKQFIAEARAFADADSDTLKARLPENVYGTQPDSQTVLAYSLGSACATIKQLCAMLEAHLQETR